MSFDDHPASGEPLHLILAAAAFDHAAQNAEAWAGPNDGAAAAMFSNLAELFRLELSDPAWSTRQATMEAISLLSDAYAAAADTVRRAGARTDLGRGELPQQGCNYAAEWLQTQADTFTILGAQIGERLPDGPFQGQVTFVPAGSGSEFPVLQFATLAVLHDDQIDITVHKDHPAADAYFHEHFPELDAEGRRIDTHTINVEDDSLWQRGAEVEFASLVVVQDAQINVTVHQNDASARVELLDRFPIVGDRIRVRHRIESHRPRVRL